MIAAFIQLLVAAVSVVLLASLLRLRLTWRASVRRATGIALLATIVTSLVLIFGTADNYVYTAKQPIYVLKYGLAYMSAWLVLSLFALALAGFLGVHRDTEDRWTPWRAAGAVVTVILFVLAGLMGFTAHWVHTYFGEIDVDEMLFVLATGRDHSTADVAAEIANNVTAPTIFAFVLGLLLVLWDVRIALHGPGSREWSMPARVVRRIAAALALTATIATGWMLTEVVPVHALISPPAATQYLEDNYVAASSDTLIFPEHRRNLVHIFLESMENTFYDTSQGGAMPRDLMPDMAALADEGVSFSNSDLRGGFLQTPGSTHTVAGLVTQTSGLPLKSPVLDMSIRKYNYPDFPMMGDLLREQGYTTEIMMAANADFGAKRELFTDHGDFTIFDHQYALDNGYLPEGYHVWWGYEDDKMYGFAREELTRLAGEGAPFYFMLETADTHFAGGYLSDEVTDRPFEQQYANVVFHSQQQAVALVRWMQEQPFWEDTTVVITGDHLTMETDFFEQVGLDPTYQRTVLNVFLNAVPEAPSSDRTHNRQFAAFDIFPTTLAAIGVEVNGDRVGLGTNLFSDTPTLIERDGFTTVEENLEAPSLFYDSHIDPHQ